MKIRAEGLAKVYKGRRVVDGVTFSFEQGQIVGLLGPNGAGKTTTFYMITGLIRPTEGRVFFDDEDVTRQPMYKRARAGVGYLAQESSVFRNLTVEDNIRLVLEAAGRPKKEIEAKVAQLVADLHIDKIANTKAKVLSGGERRRVEIARALATEPKFILLDEPFTGIDPVTIEELQVIIARLRNQGIGILITDHNVNATLSITDHNFILIDGEIIAEGSEAEIRANDLVRKHYLGHGLDPNTQPAQPEGGAE